MPEHAHGCLNCRLDMVPDFDSADPRFHSFACGTNFFAFLDGEDVGYTQGAFEGREGWVLCAGKTTADVHACPCSNQTTCLIPRFGHVEVRHECPQRRRR